jgi:hypothetical protein
MSKHERLIFIFDGVRKEKIKNHKIIEDVIEIQKKEEKTREEIKLKMIDIDPYGEDDWLDESFFSKIFKKKEKKKISILDTPFKKIHVKCKNKNEYNILMKYLEMLGYMWNSGYKPTHLNFFGYIIVIFNTKKIKIMDQPCLYKIYNVEDIVDFEYLEYKEKEIENIKLKMIDIDPYCEENWLDERNIMDYKTFEELSHPYNEEPPLIYNTYFQNNYDGFKEDLLNDLKQKLIGKKIHFEGQKQYIFDTNGKIVKDPLDNIFIDGKKINPIYTITVKDIQYNGAHRQQTYYVDLISDDGLRYILKKIVNDKNYEKYAKKVQDVLDAIEKERIRKENLKLKHLYHDPYGEESWEEDD